MTLLAQLCLCLRTPHVQSLLITLEIYLLRKITLPHKVTLSAPI